MSTASKCERHTENKTFTTCRAIIPAKNSFRGTHTHTEFSLNYTRKHTGKRTKLTPIRKETNSQTNCRSPAYTSHTETINMNAYQHTQTLRAITTRLLHTHTHTHSYAGRGQCGGAARKRGRSTLIFMGCFAKRETLISCSFEY